MDIEKIWSEHKPTGNELPAITSIEQLQHTEKPSALKRMKRLLKTNIIIAFVISIGYLIVGFIYEYWQLEVLFAMLFVYTIWSGASGFKLYRNIDENASANNLLAELKRNRDSLKQWIAMQTRVCLFIYPFSVAAGFMFGGVWGSGKSIALFMSKPIVVIALIISIAILTPIGYWLCKWMFKRSFGGLLTHLDNTIAELSETA